MFKKLKYFIPLIAFLGVFSISSYAQEEEEAEDDFGPKQQWFWHDCELGSSNGTLRECRIVESSSSCGKAKRRPSGTC